MQDTATGNMVRVKELNQESYDAAIPDRKQQGITLTIGEIVDVKGGKFKVHSMGIKMIVLMGMPGTDVARG